MLIIYSSLNHLDEKSIKEDIIIEFPDLKEAKNFQKMEEVFSIEYVHEIIMELETKLETLETIKETQKLTEEQERQLNEIEFLLPLWALVMVNLQEMKK